jgi:very-short-patch-repair endonuclease
VGHRAVHPLAYETAAVFACRPHALLSHHTAARLWELPVPASQTHVTVVGRTRRSLPTVTVHSLSHLADAEFRRLDGLPITSPSLTVLDLAGALAEEKLAEALNEARVQRLVTDSSLRASLQAHPTRKGARALAKLLKSERGPHVLRSKAEAIALRVLREHDMEPDASNYPIGPYTVDFLYKRERLIVEVDGYAYHSTRKRFVDDRRRMAYLASCRFQLFPLTWRDLHGGQAEAMGMLRRTLEERRRLLGV